MSRALLTQSARAGLYVRRAAAVPAKRARRANEQGNGHRLVALALAVAVQLAVGYFLMSRSTVEAPPGEHSIQVVLLEAPKKPPDPQPPLPPVPAAPQLHPVLPAPPVIRIEQPKPLAAPVPTQNTIAAPVAATPPPAQAPGVEDAFKAAVRAAVFAAYRVPAAARLLEQYGDTRVAFVLDDGQVSEIRILAASGHELIDQAALAAVRSAHYPAVPEALRGRNLAFEIVLYAHRTGP